MKRDSISPARNLIGAGNRTRIPLDHYCLSLLITAVSGGPDFDDPSLSHHLPQHGFDGGNGDIGQQILYLLLRNGDEGGKDDLLNALLFVHFSA